VVFDLTGRQRAEFRFDRRLRGILGHTPRELREFVERGFGRLPAGCHVVFGERTRAEILAQLKRSIPDNVHGLRALLREPAHGGLSLAEFLAETEVELDDIYRKQASWHGLRADVGMQVPPLAEGEPAALANVHKLLHVGGARLNTWQALLDGRWPSEEPGRRRARMLFAVLYGKAAAADDAGGRALLGRHAVVRAELAELIPVLRARNATLADPTPLSPDNPLSLHERYLGVEISVAFDQRTANGIFRDYYTGVERTGGGAYDLLFVTIERGAATKEHLNYRDFPLNPTRFHWQSKSATRRASVDGQRLLDPASAGCTALLFVRARPDDRPGVTMAFQYLGPADPDGHHGERPITIEWALRHPMPGAIARAGRIAG